MQHKTSSALTLDDCRPVRIAYDEELCIKGNMKLFEYHVPIGDKSDF